MEPPTTAQARPLRSAGPLETIGASFDLDTTVAPASTIGNSALDARPYSLAGIDTQRPAYNQIQGMFSFGGPLRIPRLVRNGPDFYVNYQFTRNRNVLTQTGLMPTQAERNGDLSRSPGKIFDPANNLPFTDNRIPYDRISSQAKPLLNLLPLPNFTGSALYNYQVPLAGSTHSDSVIANLSRSIGRKDQVSGNFSLQSSRATAQRCWVFSTPAARWPTACRGTGCADSLSSLPASLSMNQPAIQPNHPFLSKPREHFGRCGNHWQ